VNVTFIKWLPVAVGLLLLVGCNSAAPVRHEVQGKVVYKGEPVPSGRIMFSPDSAKGNRGPQGYAMIQNGHYDTRKGGKGVVSGPQIVKIDGFNGLGHEVGPGEDSGPSSPTIPAYEKSIDFPTKDTVLDFDLTVAEQTL
jgi:hypothetical protein